MTWNDDLWVCRPGLRKHSAGLNKAAPAVLTEDLMTNGQKRRLVTDNTKYAFGVISVVIKK